MATNDKLSEIVSFCKRRGFVYPSSEIYSGFAAVYDLGPYGVELLKNIGGNGLSKIGKILLDSTQPFL